MRIRLEEAIDFLVLAICLVLMFACTFLRDASAEQLELAPSASAFAYLDPK
jgi:hypothetical protein